MSKTAGFNKVGKTLPIPVQQPWEVTKDEHKQLLDQMNPRLGTLTTQTTYVYVDKPLIEQLHNQKKISDEVYNGIKTTLMNELKLDYSKLPDKYESYKIDGLGSWSTPTGS